MAPTDRDKISPLALDHVAVWTEVRDAIAGFVSTYFTYKFFPKKQ